MKMKLLIALVALGGIAAIGNCEEEEAWAIKFSTASNTYVVDKAKNFPPDSNGMHTFDWYCSKAIICQDLAYALNEANKKRKELK